MRIKIALLIYTLGIALLLRVPLASAQAAFISFSPAQVMQGDPLLIQVENITDISGIKKLTFAGKKVGMFLYQNKPSGLVGIDLNQKPGMYEMQAELSDGTLIKNNMEITERKKIEVPLGIPEKLGGNTKASEDKLVATLVAEKKSLANIPTSPKALWTNKFTPPLSYIFVTDPYGFSRKTGAYSIPHKGTDYRAKIGTEVMAVNHGIVRITKFYRNYGNTVIIDHGLGLMTYYLHLSKIKVKVGQVVEQGQVIALSGDTGYTAGAHLHLSLNIDHIAIDPVKFFELFQ